MHLKNILFISFTLSALGQTVQAMQPLKFNPLAPRHIPSRPVVFVDPKQNQIMSYLETELKNQKTPLFKNKRDLSFCKEIIEILNNKVHLQEKHLPIAYDIATTLRHNKNFLDSAQNIFHSILSSSVNNAPLKSKCYRGLAKIECFGKNDISIITRFIEQAIKLNPKDGMNYLWFANIPTLPSAVRTKYYKEVLKCEKKTNKPFLKIQALIGLGNARYIDEYHQNQAAWYLEALQILGEEDTSDLKIQALIGLGNARYIDEYHQNQAAWYLEALKILGEEDTSDLKAQALIGLGNARYTDKNHKNNTVWYLEALKILGDKDTSDLKVQALIGLGNARYIDTTHKNNTDWYLEALAILGDKDTSDLKVQALIGLGNAAGSKKNEQEAIKWYEKALKIRPNNNFIESKITRCQEFIQNKNLFRN